MAVPDRLIRSIAPQRTKVINAVHHTHRNSILCRRSESAPENEKAMQCVRLHHVQCKLHKCEMQWRSDRSEIGLDFLKESSKSNTVGAIGPDLKGISIQIVL